MAKSTQIKVLVVRAGASAWDEAGRLSGSADLPLSDGGRAAVAEFAGSLTEGSLWQVWSGPEESAEGTARAIGAKAGAKVRVIGDLHELGVGLWEGLDRADAEERGGRAFRQWRANPAGIVPPGGESVADASDRVLTAVRGLLGRCRGDESCGVCIVVRPMVYGLVRCWLSGDEAGSLWSVAFGDEMAEWLLVDRGAVRGGSAGGRGGALAAG